jgi:hypothetical protein
MFVIALVQLELIYTPLPFIGLAFVKHLTIDIFIDILWVNAMLKVRRFVKPLSLEVQKYFVFNTINGIFFCEFIANKYKLNGIWVF